MLIFNKLMLIFNMQCVNIMKGGNEMQDIYKIIKSRREELGYTQDDLATKLGYKNRSSINKIEAGINDIPQSKIKEFAIALETTPSYLLGIEVEEQKINTIAAHREGNEDWTEDELAKIEEYKNLILAARNASRQ